MKNRDYSFDYRSLPEPQRRQIMNQWAKTANRRLRRLRESGVDDTGSIHRKYLDKLGRRTFATEKTKMSQYEVDIALAELQNFLTSDQSTLTGIKRTVGKIVDKINKRRTENPYNEYKIIDYGIDLNQFYNFLHSQQYKNMIKYYDSDDVIDMFLDDIQKMEYSELMEQYGQYVALELSIDEVQEIINNPNFVRIKK